MKNPEPKLLDTIPRPEYNTVPVEKIRPTDPAAKSATTASIDAVGFASSVVLRRLSDRDRTRGGMNFDVDPHEYEVVDGEGRVSDAKAAGILEVPAIIYPADTPPVVLDFLRTVRNNARRNNPVAEARSYQALVNHGMPPDEIAKTQGVKVATIRKRLRLASLDDEFLEAVVEKKIAVGTAERIANLSTSAKDDVRRVLRESGRVRGKDVSRVLDAERADALQGMPGIFPDAPEKGEAPPVENVERGDPTFALREAIRRHLERGESKRSIERLTDEVYSEVHG